METKDNNNEWNNRESGALWVRTKKDSSEKYLTGHFVTKVDGKENRTKVIIFSNKKGKEKNEKAPDYIIYESVEEGVAPQKVIEDQELL
mgnify:CR=1 FL=1|jgi:hypothetical protein|tara:strand:- start:1568 stop:1834 length:267 start_codon:yes stop_codon:yes gene_type:complete